MKNYINQDNVDDFLGNSVDVLTGEKDVLGEGTLSYEQNTGRLSIYSKDGSLKKFLNGGEKLRFPDNPGIEYEVHQSALKSRF